ncbi:MAG: hypothetical protein AAF399_13280 [Bacteroidota bacterium]
MSSLTKLFCGLTLITIPTIEFGGYFLLQILSGNQSELGLTPFQEGMFRAGHGHAGVLVILSLLAQIFTDYAVLSKSMEWLVRIGFPVAAMLVSGGFFAAASGPGLTEPNGGITLLYIGVGLLAAGLVVLGIGLIKARKA